MRKIILEIELEYDDDIMHSDDKESRDWFYNDILLGTRGELILHSNEIGDEIGPVKVIRIKDHGQRQEDQTTNTETVQ